MSTVPDKIRKSNMKQHICEVCDEPLDKKFDVWDKCADLLRNAMNEPVVAVIVKDENGKVVRRRLRK